MRVAANALLLLTCWTASVSAAEIDACKYLLVSDLAGDTFSLARQLREQGAAVGFTTVSSQAEVPAADVFKSCIIVGSWLGTPDRGQLAIRVIDAASGAPIAATNIGGWNWLGLERTLRTAISKVYSEFQYTGYKEEAYQERIRRLYPPRPKYSVTESGLKDLPSQHLIEGIWSDTAKSYRLAIVQAPKGSPFTHVAVVLGSTSPLWQPGEIKAGFTAKDPAQPIETTFYMENKRPLTTSFVLEDGVMQATLSTPVGMVEFALTREK